MLTGEYLRIHPSLFQHKHNINPQNHSIMNNGKLRPLKQCPLCFSNKNVRCRVSEDKLYLCCFNPPHVDRHTAVDVKETGNYLAGKYYLLKSGESGCSTFVHESAYNPPSRKESDKRQPRKYEPFTERPMLFTQHYDALLARGLSKQDIIDGRFRSLSDFYISTHFTNGTGFDIPCWAGDRIGSVNYQTAWDNRNPKYSWAIAGESGRWYKKEMPLTYINLDNLSGATVLACEGMLKPYITYCTAKRTLPVLGAAGGCFSASREYLAQLIRRYKIGAVVYCPDAGWKQLRRKSPNQVFRQVNDALITFADAGLVTYLADWGQGELSKEEGLDIDEYFLEWEIDGHEFIDKISTIRFDA